MKTLILSAALALALAGNAFAAEKTGLSAPIIMLTGVIAKNVEVLKLTDEQQVVLKDWLATKPAMRKGFEAQVVAMRTELSSAILSGAPKDTRIAMAGKIGEAETKLLMMRSNCADHWRAALSEEQFAQAVELAAAK
ncbi:MAG: hypothetical protein COB39_03025 [Marinosulfonomonas sp.]|nr:MAG: hypothetical protein COB39_03025 [Marinosulfonomonas sp.]